jgi:hypothetical protein
MTESTAVSKNAESRPEGICKAENHDLATGQSHHARGTLADFLKRYKIPKKSYFDSPESDGEITDPYEEDYYAISSANVVKYLTIRTRVPRGSTLLRTQRMFP